VINSKGSPTYGNGLFSEKKDSSSMMDLDSVLKSQTGGNLYPGLPPKRVLGIGGTDIAKK